jgi:hypothetical protein
MMLDDVIGSDRDEFPLEQQSVHSLRMLEDWDTDWDTEAPELIEPVHDLALAA